MVINHRNRELLEFWLSDEGQRRLEVLRQDFLIERQTVFALSSLNKIEELRDNLKNKTVAQYLHRTSPSTSLSILDIGCGNGWEALGLAFLLYPANVVGISNDPGGVQNWDKGSGMEGAVKYTLPKILEDIRSALSILSGAGYVFPDRLKGLYDALKTAYEHVELMQHDIQNPSWPQRANSHVFDLVFSRSSFYHVEDRVQALRNIKNKMSARGVYLLDEPKRRDFGAVPDLTSEWLMEVAVGEVGFSNFELIDDNSIIQGLLIC